MVCCIAHVAADLITNPTLRCRFDVCVCSESDILIFWVCICIFSRCAFCTDGICPDVYYS